MRHERRIPTHRGPFGGMTRDSEGPVWKWDRKRPCGARLSDLITGTGSPNLSAPVRTGNNIRRRRQTRAPRRRAGYRGTRL